MATVIQLPQSRLSWTHPPGSVHHSNLGSQILPPPEMSNDFCIKLLPQPPANSLALVEAFDRQCHLSNFWQAELKLPQLPQNHGSTTCFLLSSPLAAHIKVPQMLLRIAYNFSCWKSKLHLCFKHEQQSPLNIPEDFVVFQNAPPFHVFLAAKESYRLGWLPFVCNWWGDALDIFSYHCAIAMRPYTFEEWAPSRLYLLLIYPLLYMCSNL